MEATFDVDWLREPNGFIVSSDLMRELIIRHIRLCDKVVGVESRPSASGNGFHVRVECGGDELCDICRMVFDSPGRLDLDTGPIWTRGVLWDEKTYVKGGARMRGVAGPWSSVSCTKGEAEARARLMKTQIRNQRRRNRDES